MSTDSLPTVPLQEEREFFAANQPTWASQFPGKFVLVKGRALINTFDKAEDALSSGLERFGGEPFLVRPVEQTEAKVFIPALAFGILSLGQAA